MTRRKLPTPAAPSPEDAALFREAIGPVRELQPTPLPPEVPRPAPRPRQRELDEEEALLMLQRQPFELAGAALGETAEHAQESLPPRVLRRLRRGQYSVQDELDLHGFTAAAAAAALRRFLRECRADDRLCVRVVHGKGLRSGHEGPVLKGLVEHLLQQRADVLAYASAPEAQGGTGALLVLLARRRAPGAPAVDELT